MTINVFLSAKIMKTPSFIREERNNRAGSKYEHIEWAGIRLNHVDNATGRPVFTLNKLSDPIPYVFTLSGDAFNSVDTFSDDTPVIDEITLRDIFTSDPPRRIGVYRIEGAPGEIPIVATATLDLGTNGQYELDMKAVSLHDAQDLYFLIRRGNILPAEPWDEPQIEREESSQVFEN
jgi:hypothetical protein